MAKIYPNGMNLSGKVEVIELLHIAGQGITYKAKSLPTGDTVLLKQLNADPKTTNGRIAAKRFLREQSIRIESDHIPTNIDYFEHEGYFFIIMEFIDGQNLDELLTGRTTPLSNDEAHDIFHQCSEGLAVAHRSGIIHRDIKPANIMIEKATGRVVLVDWGLARFVDEKTLHDSSDPMGTLHFMSPEHIRNRGVDRQSDLFSFGVLAYLCVTKQLPFDGVDEEAVFRSIIYDTPVAPQSLNPGIDKELEAIILRLLEKEKTKRYPDAYALIRDLDDGYGAFLGGVRCKCGEPIATGTTFCVTCGAPRHTLMAPYTGSLLILNGMRKDTRIEILPSGIKVGRYDLDPDDDFISRNHASIFFADGFFWVEDADTLNGTSVNSHAIPRGGRQPLMPGDHVRFADTFCEFVD